RTRSEWRARRDGGAAAMVAEFRGSCSACDMLLVFAQSNDESFPARFAEQQGAVHFGLAVVADDGGANVTMLKVSSDGVRWAFCVSVRRVTGEDLARARAAASTGRAPGMAE